MTTMAQAEAIVHVKLADVEPVAAFIKAAAEADALFRKMTPDEAAALPGWVAAGIAKIQRALLALEESAIADVAGAQPGHVPGARPPRY